MEKFSVKKPFTILVAVIMVLLLGFVSITNLQTNLLPDISTPYLMVVTVYPGASPERVESEVSDVMENALGTVSGVENITATSAENYSLLLMKFAEGTDMNSAMVKTSNKVDQTASSLPSTCLTPSIIEYSLNMNAFMTVAVSREGADQYELSEFIQKTLVPELQRRGGVSSVSSSGLVDKMVQVQLNQDKINDINAKLLELIQGGEEKESDIIARMNSAKLVIFDDLGAERNTDYALEKIYNIIDSRYRRKLPMLLTTNLTIDEMKDEEDRRYSRIYDRIFETCYTMQFTGPSWRKKEASRRFTEMEKLFDVD